PGASSSSRAALEMISTRFLAALLMLNIWAGYPLPGTQSRKPRVDFCETPLTVSRVVSNGKVVSMPGLRLIKCRLAGVSPPGIHCAHTGTPVPPVTPLQPAVGAGGTVVHRVFQGWQWSIGSTGPIGSRGAEFEGPPGAYAPVMCGLSQVWLAVSPGLSGKSYVLTALAAPVPPQLPGTLLDAPSVKSTITRRPDRDASGTERSSSHPR